MPDPSSSPTPLPSIEPQAVAAELAAKLASRSRHVCLFLGAGASCAAGLPDLKSLQAEVSRVLTEPGKSQFEALIAGRNLEDALSRLRRIRSLLSGTATFDSFTSDSALSLDEQICSAIVRSLDISKSSLDAASDLARWAGRNSYSLPIEIFTINYDTLLEAGLEKLGVPYFDGFIGNMRARFRSDLVDIADGGSTLPASFIRLWKLHGSAHWVTETIEGHKEVIRLGAHAGDGRMAAIYPSDEKYADSRRVPFVVLLDRLRRALEIPETIVLVSGYSFGDQHLNELLFDAARRRPRSEVVALFRSAIPSALDEKARQLLNFTILGGERAIIGGEERRWDSKSTLPGIWDGAKFLLGDFKNLAQFLARTGGHANG